MADGLSLLALVLGGLACAANCYLSFGRYALHRMRGKPAETYRHASGLPLVGSLLVAASLIELHGQAWILAGGLVLIAIDTGGIHWFLGTLLYQRLRRTPGSR